MEDGLLLRLDCLRKCTGGLRELKLRAGKGLSRDCPQVGKWSCAPCYGTSVRWVTFAQFAPPELWPCVEMTGAVIMGDLQGTLLFDPCPTFSSSHGWMLCGGEEVLCPVRCSLPSGCEQYPPAPMPHHGPFFF